MRAVLLGKPNPSKILNPVDRQRELTITKARNHETTKSRDPKSTISPSSAMLMSFYFVELFMVEPRAPKHQRERRVGAFREEIDLILEGELGDPRIGLVAVSEVVLAPGGKMARVFVRVDGDEEEAEQTLDGLNAAKGFIRHQLTESMGLRHAPELVFVIDRAEQYSSRIDELLGRTKRRKKRL
jgi:ribosome-binding factor A